MTSTTPNEAARRYAEMVEQGQQAMLNAVESWTRAARDATKQFGSTTPITPSFDTEGLVDQVYDFATNLLEVQRGLSKQLLTAAVESGKEAGRQAKKG